MVMGTIATRFAGFGCITYARAGGLSRRIGDFLEFDLDREGLLAAAQDHAAQRRDVAEVAAPAQHDVLVPHHDAVGGIDVQPAMLRPEPGADPGMRLVGAEACAPPRDGRVRM